MSEIRKFTIVRYGTLEEDENGVYIDTDGDSGMALVEGNELILSGDWYHDKIDSLIDGFFQALVYLSVKYEVEEIEKVGYASDDMDWD